MEGIGTVAAIGGILLAIVLLWAVFRNSRRSVSDVRRTEEATHDLRTRMDREDKISDPDPARY